MLQSLLRGSPGRAETSGKGSSRLCAIRLTKCQHLLACLVAGGQGGRRAGAVVRGGDVAGQMRCGGGTPEAGRSHPAGGGPFTIALTGYQILTHRPVERILNGLSRPSIRSGGLSASARKGSGKEGAGRFCAASVNPVHARRRAASFPHASVHYRPYRLSTQHLIAI